MALTGAADGHLLLLQQADIRQGCRQTAPSRQHSLAGDRRPRLLTRWEPGPGSERPQAVVTYNAHRLPASSPWRGLPGAIPGTGNRALSRARGPAGLEGRRCLT
jgi:hypothetical protein